MKTSKQKTLSATRPKHLIWHPFTQHATAPEPIAIERGEGARLYAKNGDVIIDAISSWWVNIHGHGHPKIAEAIAEQAHKLEHVIFAGFTHDPAEETAEKLHPYLPKGIDHIFFSDNGSTCLEVSLKMAIAYWHHKGKSEKKSFLHFADAYHGDTFGAMSISGSGLFNSLFDDHKFHTYAVPTPKKDFEEQTLFTLKTILNSHADEIAAFVLEPLVMGVAGMVMYSEECLRFIVEICREYDVLVIADEVMTGFGRTGTMFACEQADIVPDILCISKGITAGFVPLAATCATSEVFNAFYSEDRTKTFFHGHSYTGNPLACAAASANLDLFAEDTVWQQISDIEAYHKQALKDLPDSHMIWEKRSKGTIAAIEFQAQDSGYLSAIGPHLYNHAIQNGVLLRPLGNVIYVLPPYCITKEELDKIYGVLGEAIEQFKQ